MEGRERFTCFPASESAPPGGVTTGEASKRAELLELVGGARTENPLEDVPACVILLESLAHAA